jgi:hypothetical protein
MRFRKLRIVFSALCGIACVLLIVLWVRSYWYWDQVYCQYSGLRYGVGIMSIRGGTYITLRDYDSSPSSRRGVRLDNGVAIRNSHGNHVSNWWLYLFDYDKAYVPYWIVNLLIGALAAAPWIRWSRRFSLRTLLIATTLVAVVLGLAVYAARK